MGQATKETEKVLCAKGWQGSCWRSKTGNKGRTTFYPEVLDNGCPSQGRHICSGHLVAAGGPI